MENGCEWRGCDETAALVVLVGPQPSEAKAYGPFCISHAALTCADLRREQPDTIWFDWLARRRDRGTAPGEAAAPVSGGGCRA